MRYFEQRYDFEKMGKGADRLKSYAELKGMRQEAFLILHRILLQGEMPRGEAERVTGLKGSGDG